MPKKDDNSIIQSVDRALSLLDEIASKPGVTRSLAELTKLLGVDRSSVFRLLNTLSIHGLIKQSENEKGYELGYGIFRLAGALRVQTKITDLVKPYLKQLVKYTGENAHLAVLAGNRCIFIDREQGTRTLTANTNIGDTEELYCTAVGKSLICEREITELQKLLINSEFVQYTDNTITDVKSLHKQLQDVKKSGIAYDNEEYEPNVFCMASPIRDFEKNIKAAIGLSGPSARLKPNKDEYGDFLLTIGKEVSRLLGYESTVEN